MDARVATSVGDGHSNEPGVFSLPGGIGGLSFHEEMLLTRIQIVCEDVGQFIDVEVRLVAKMARVFIVVMSLG